MSDSILKVNIALQKQTMKLVIVLTLKRVQRKLGVKIKRIKMKKSLDPQICDLSGESLGKVNISTKHNKV